mgnify:CR=1 FL=1
MSVGLKDTSIKTRIETELFLVVVNYLGCLKDTSIKTRIETTHSICTPTPTGCLKDTSIKTRIETQETHSEMEGHHSV